MTDVTVVGAGLAGCEAAWQLARRGLRVGLIEMKPDKKTPAHVSDDFCELVCSNSLRSDELTNAVGLLKEEMRRLGSLVIACADMTRIPAGGALAVDRARFARMVTEKVAAHPYITVTRREQTGIPDGTVVVATGPLTDGDFAAAIEALTGGARPLSFFDAAAPIVALEGVDMSRAWFASRYGKGTADYLNCPMDEADYKAFRRELAEAEEAPVHGFDDGRRLRRLPAHRGHGAPRRGHHAVWPAQAGRTARPRNGEGAVRRRSAPARQRGGDALQSRRLSDAPEIREQKRVFSMIPALKNADFVRYGVMHRNTFLESPRLLDRYYRLKSEPRVRFAGQMTGVEGYVESAASGLLAGLETARELRGLPGIDFPKTTAVGALACISPAAVWEISSR